VLDSTFTLVPAVEPNTTVLTLLKFLPVTVTRVPPSPVPPDGDTRETAGRGVAAAFATAADVTERVGGAADAIEELPADNAATTANVSPNANTLRRLTQAP
jgi:hypothetical protein